MTKWFSFNFGYTTEQYLEQTKQFLCFQRDTKKKIIRNNRKVKIKWNWKFYIRFCLFFEIAHNNIHFYYRLCNTFVRHNKLLSFTKAHDRKVFRTCSQRYTEIYGVSVYTLPDKWILYFNYRLLIFLTKAIKTVHFWQIYYYFFVRLFLWLMLLEHLNHAKKNDGFNGL